MLYAYEQGTLHVTPFKTRVIAHFEKSARLFVIRLQREKCTFVIRYMAGVYYVVHHAVATFT